MFRLIDCCKRSYNPYFFGNQFTNQAIQFYNRINLKNPNLNELSTQLNQAIKNFDFAISTIEQFDDNKKSNVTMWQEEASKDITPLLNQAIEEMKKVLIKLL